MKLNMQNGIAVDGVKEPFLKGIMERKVRINKQRNTYDRYPSCRANRKNSNNGDTQLL